MTETAAFSSMSSLDGYKKTGVKEFEISAAFDSTTCSDCGENDGKHYSIDDFKIGITAPPFHPNCRCTTLPYYNDMDDLVVHAARNKDGESYEIEENITFKEWKDKYVDSNDKSNNKKQTEPKFTEKIEDIRYRISKNGGKIQETDILEAGKALSKEFSIFRSASKIKFEEAQAKINSFGLTDMRKRLIELDESIRGLKVAREVGLNSNEEVEIEFRKFLEKFNLIRASEEYGKAYDAWKLAHKEYYRTFSENAEWLYSKLSEIRKMGAETLDISAHLCNSRSPMRKVVEKAYKYYPTDWIEKSIAKGTLTPKKVDRGYYSDYNKIIAISGNGDNDSVKTAIHELGHRFENVVSGIRKAEKEFYNRRTAGEDLVWLGEGYSKSEKTRKDNFVHPYMGKDYGGSAFELVSMGFEYAYTNPVELSKDSDMQAWIYGILSLY